jgi:hypothetical protein
MTAAVCQQQHHAYGLCAQQACVECAAGSHLLVTVETAYIANESFEMMQSARTLLQHSFCHGSGLMPKLWCMAIGPV